MNKWLKIGAIVVVVALGIAALGGIALAQGPKDDEGTCDTCGEEMGEGYRRGRSSDLEDGTRGRGWDKESKASRDDCVDEDGDGECDLCDGESGEQKMHSWRYDRDGDAQGQGRERSEGDKSLCDDFVDEDADGLCDNFVDEDGDGICDEDDEDDHNAGGDGYGARGSQQSRGSRGGRGGSRSNGK